LSALRKPWTSIATAVALVAAPAAMAADAITVESLLAQGYVVTAAIPSQIGPGLFLQKGTVLFACFVSEKPGSADLTTVYCKPVH
jgi:hypothetical protein